MWTVLKIYSQVHHATHKKLGYLKTLTVTSAVCTVGFDGTKSYCTQPKAERNKQHGHHGHW